MNWLADIPDLDDERPPLQVANSAAAQARTARSTMLLQIARGDIDIIDAIKQAETDHTGALRRTRLRKVLTAQEGVGEERAERIISKTALVAEYDLADRAHMLSLRISWLLDERTGGRRLAAFCDTIQSADDRATAPWAGFPYATEGAP